MSSKEGWGWPFNSRKAHYFVPEEPQDKIKRSLCGQWLYGGQLEQGNDESPDNCKECIRRLEKRRKRSCGVGKSGILPGS